MKIDTITKGHSYKKSFDQSLRNKQETLRVFESNIKKEAVGQILLPELNGSQSVVNKVTDSLEMD